MDKRVQLRLDDGKWIDINMTDLKEFDVFRVLDSRDNEMIDAKGRKYFIVAGNSHQDLDKTMINVY